MRKAWVALAVAGLLLFLPINSASAGAPAVQLAGLRIVGPGSGLNGTELRAFSQSSGVTLALLVRAPNDKKIVEVDDSKCVLRQLSDSQGVNLLDGVDWGGFPTVSKEGDLALIEVSTKGRPSRDAVRLHAKGTVRLRVAASQKTGKIEELKLEVGAQTEILQETVKVMKAQWENDGLNLVLQVSRNFKNNMKEIRFYTPDGGPIEVWGRGSFTFGNASQLEYNLSAKSKTDSLIVEMDVWQELEELDLPFDLESGVGL